ncbi:MULTISPECIES: O-methyltransferase [Halolamina]|uniref:Predicted O-methyltransferase YrrM n=1 Tax=Halolamina pelagica TaxID=699431 RepID=A0A1I5NYP6_9EURY|nr:MULTISPECIES: O-methyltransferase [Halolamina]NHX36543.1 O-methyltransferase [Halolamina sp. R1-12]SFP26948.1 Predicted O-methyltransferase YrrM [Halolamina pelagica]
MDLETVERYVRATGADHSDVQAEMAEYADENDFPIIGPDAGAVLRMLARLTDADRVFEFGSGYGYSASWFLAGGADEVVLTEIDEDELDMAREFLASAGVADRARFEHGDALELVEAYGGPFDVVLIDHDKPRYAQGFDQAREKVPEGGVIAADNMTRGPIDLDALTAYFAGDEPLPDGASDGTEGIANYVEHVRADPAFESFVLPVGSGLCLSTRVTSRGN